ncbi:hypothetical protein [Streptomyces sp. NBC_01563]|uniref:hypothetical protein n=1 Tax=Streptomyces sp. NBC_01563 TaxID=2975880 RepID=UPI00386EB471
MSALTGRCSWDGPAVTSHVPQGHPIRQVRASRRDRRPPWQRRPPPAGRGPSAGPCPCGATSCSYTDPTGGRCLTGAASHGYKEILKKWPRWRGGTGCQPPRSEGGEHPLGRACDYTPGTLGKRASGTALAQGWTLAAWLRKNADTLHVQYIIWQGRIRSINHPQDQNGWGRPYDHGLNNPHTVTGGHYDHVHVTYEH